AHEGRPADRVDPDHCLDRARHGRRSGARTGGRLRRLRHQADRHGAADRQDRRAGSGWRDVNDGQPVATEFRARSLRELGGVLAFVDRTCAGVEADTVFAVRLAVEEAFTNIYKHGYSGGEGPVAVRVDVAPGKIIATLSTRHLR